jgi:F-box protein 45
MKQIRISHQTVQSLIPSDGSAVVAAEKTAKQLHTVRSDWSSLSPKLMDKILSYLSLTDVYNMSQTCVSWSRVMREENSPFWKRICSNRIPASLIKSDILSSVPTAKAKVRALAHTWNPDDCSRNIYVKTNGFTLHRNPVAQSTDAARGLIGFKSGRHCWEIWWDGPLGTVSVIGIATKEQSLQSSGYVPLIGSSSHSWGWNLVDNQLLFDGDVHGSYPLMNNAPKYTTGERIRVILDCDRHTLSFEKNYEFLGVAFIGLPAKTMLFPAVSAVYGNTEVSMVYTGFPLDG